MTMFLTGARTPSSIEHLDERTFGLLITPKTNYDVASNWAWAADNGCFNNDTYVGDDKWFSWLDEVAEKDAQSMSGCMFATAPDVVGDAVATLKRSSPWLPKIRSKGLPAAFVAQNGLTGANDPKIPWDEFDALFIGGDDEFKLGPIPIELSAEAHARGKHVHVGRVNSYVRFKHCALEVKADSVDGTFLAFGPNKNLPRLLGWFAKLNIELAA